VVSERRACRVVRQWRGTQRYQPLRRTDEEELTQAILALGVKYGRYGYRRITVLLQNAGWPVGKDRVQRIWRREGLKVPQKPPILSAIGFHQLCVNAYFTFRYIAPRILFLKMGTGESFGQPDAAQQVGKAAIGAEAVQFGAKRRGRNRTARRQLIVRESGLELSCSLNLAKQRARGSCTAPQEVCLSGSFVADIGRSDVQGILAGRILWEHPSGHSLFEQPQDRSAVLDNDP